MEDKLRELYEQAIKQERNKVYLAIEEETEHVGKESDKQDITIDFLLEELDKFEAKYQEDRYLQIKTFAEEFNYALKKYGKLDFSEIIEKSKDYYSQNHQELIINNNPKYNPLNYKNENLTYELAIYNAWVEMSEARILTLDNPDLDVFDIGDYLAMDTALPKTLEKFEEGDLLKQFNSREASRLNIQNSITEMKKNGESKDFISIYTHLHSILSDKNNDFYKPLIREIDVNSFIEILLGINTVEKVSWESFIYLLIYLLDSLAKEGLLKETAIEITYQQKTITINNYILSNFVHKGEVFPGQTIYNSRTEIADKRSRGVLKHLNKIDQIIKLIKTSNL